MVASPWPMPARRAGANLQSPPRAFRHTLLFLLFFLFTPLAAHAATLYVDPQGDGTSGATWATALRTVQAAANVAQSGDTVEISGGTYTEAVTTKADGVTFARSSQPGHDGTVTIKGGNAQTVLTVRHQTTWRQLSFDASANTDSSYYVVSIQAGHPTFDQCVIGPGQRLLNIGSGGADFSRTIIRDARRNAYGGAVYIAAGAAGATTFTYSMIAETGYGYIQVVSGKRVDFNNCLFAGFGGGVLFLDTGASVAEGVHWTNCLALSNGIKGNPIIENDAANVTVTVDHSRIQGMSPFYLTAQRFTGNVVETNPLSGSPGLHRGRRLALLNLGIDDEANVGVWSQLADTCDLYGFKATLALNTASVTEADWTVLRERVARGHEVSSHTAHHVYLPERRLFEIKYSGSEAATLTVDRQALTLSVSVAGNAAASFTLPLSPTGAYATVAKVRQYIAAKANYTCNLFTVSGTSYDSGQWLSQDIQAVDGVSITGNLTTVSLDDAAANQDELAIPKQTIEQNLSTSTAPYTCDTLIYPYLKSNASVQAAAQAAGYAYARGSSDDSFAMGSPTGYNVMQILATLPGEVFGRNVPEATLRERVSAVLEFAKFTGAAFSLFSHGENEYTVAEWRTLVRLLAEDPDVRIVTLREIGQQITQNATSQSGTTYYRTNWPDIADYVPGPHSPLVDAGAALATATVDFGGMSVPAGTIPSVGLYQWPRDGKVNADAGGDQTLSGTISGSLDGKDSLTPLTIASRAWTQVGGPTATLSDATSSLAHFTVSGLAASAFPVSLTFKLAITGLDGTSDYDYQRVTLTWPNTPPSASILGLPASPTSQASVTLTIGGIGVTAYRYSLDGGNWSGVISVDTPLSLTVADGSHVLSVIGGDAAGLWQSQAAPTSVTWTVDTSPPISADYSGQPTSPTSATGATITVGDGGGTIAGYKYSTDGVTWSAEIAVATPIVLTGLADGSHTLYLLVRDTAGNWQTTPTTYTWTVDTTPPSSATYSGQPASLTTATGATITVGDGGGTIAGYKYSTDGITWSGEIALTTPIVLTGLADGSHTLYLLVRDTAGNWQTTPTTYTWTVDTTPPTAALTAPPPSVTNSRSLTLNVVAGDVTAYKYSLDGAAFGVETPVGTPISLTNLVDGGHNVAIIGRDSLGNWQTEANATIAAFTVDATAPVAVISGTPADPTNSTAATLTVSGTDVVTYQYQLDAGSWQTEVAVATPISLANLADGRHTVSVIGRDTAGNLQSAATPTTVAWTVDTVAPIATLTSAQGSPTNSTTAVFDVSGADVTAYKYKLDNGLFSGAISVATDISLTGLADGGHVLSVIGRDAAGNWQSTNSPTTVAWVVDTQAPIASLSGLPASPTNRPDATITVAGDGVNYYQYALDGGVYGAEAAVDIPISLSGLTDGSHTLRVIGRDLAGNWQRTPTEATWIVDTHTPLAVLSGAPTGTTNATTATITVSGDGVTSYRYDLDGGGYGAQTPAATPIGLTGLADGSHTLSVLGHNDAGTWQVTPSTATWTVNTAAPTAVLSGLPPSPSNASTASVTVGGADVATYQYRLDAGLWSALTAADLPIALTDLGNGSHTLDVVGCNTLGTCQSQAAPVSATWVVDTTPPAMPDIPPASNPTVTPSSRPTLTWTPVADAADYLLEVADNAGFASPLVQKTLAGQTIYTLAATEALSKKGLWFWRVRARDAAGNVSVWASASFTYAPQALPQLLLLLSGSP